jgi:hypothetical protein
MLSAVSSRPVLSYDDRVFVVLHEQSSQVSTSERTANSEAEAASISAKITVLGREAYAKKEASHALYVHLISISMANFHELLHYYTNT